MQTTTVLVFVVVASLVCISMADGQRVKKVVKKRSAPGGLSTMKNNEAKGIALFAVGTMGTNYSLVKVTKAQKQVVAGTMYHLTMTVTQTNPVNNALKKLSCDIKVFERYDMIKDLNSFCCNNL